MRITKYIPNILLAAATSIFFYHGGKSFGEAQEYRKEAIQYEGTDHAYYKKSLNGAARMSNVTGAVQCGVGGLLLLIAGGDAYRMRKEELEEKLKKE